MVEHRGGLDEQAAGEQDLRLQAAEQRAERAEAELARVSAHDGKEVEPATPATGAHALHEPDLRGIDALRQDTMMRHLLQSLDAGQHIGHYGRLVFAMVARHFLPDADVLAELTRDSDFSEEQAEALLRDVKQRDYNPPRRERILEWQAEQEFPLLPSPKDPDCGNVYRSLHFPERTYKHIEEYQEERAASEA